MLKAIFNRIVMNEFYSANEGLIAIIGLLIAIFTIHISILQPIINYTTAQKKLNRDKRFSTYHELIDHFTGTHGTAMLDRQIAIVYELRNFPEYYGVTERILNGWIDRKNSITQSYSEKLISEMELTVKYINSSWLERKFKKV